MSAADCWLWIVGIGEDGWSGLNAEARETLACAEVVYGGARHLDLIPTSACSAPRMAWPSPMDLAIQQILARRGSGKITVLASGDPMLYGVGVPLTRTLRPEEFRVIPQVSALSLACARLGWPVATTSVLSLVNRPLAHLQRQLYPGQRIMVFSESDRTPMEVARFLTQAGFGESHFSVLENLGGASERCVHGTAAGWDQQSHSRLNMIAIHCVRDLAAESVPLTTGLPDAAFETDGQLTKREVRAVTLARLAPLPGQLLWDVGAGSGSIGIEWMRVHPACACIAFEQEHERAERIRRNASRLGVPGLTVVEGVAPQTFAGQAAPDTIFLGGGSTEDGLFEACWSALFAGGRLVANAVTIESEACMIGRHRRYGGDLVRMTVSHADPVGDFHGWRTLMPITQWTVTKG